MNTHISRHLDTTFTLVLPIRDKPLGSEVTRMTYTQSILLDRFVTREQKIGRFIKGCVVHNGLRAFTFGHGLVQLFPN